MVEAPTWRDRTEGVESGGNVVEAPTWHVRGGSIQMSIMDNNPDLERGQGFSWDRVVQFEVCLEGGNQHTCDAIESMNVDTSVLIVILGSEAYRFCTDLFDSGSHFVWSDRPI